MIWLESAEICRNNDHTCFFYCIYTCRVPLKMFGHSLRLFWTQQILMFEKACDTYTSAITLRFLTSQHVFCLWFHACNLLHVTSPQKQVTDVSLVLKDSDMDSENLSSLIRLSVSDGQKTDSSKAVSVIGI